jgi:N6-adenosine-specific RNA methylase IME4
VIRPINRTTPGDNCSVRGRERSIIGPATGAETIVRALGAPTAHFEDLPQRYFGAILADPPWRFATFDKATTVSARGKRMHYRIMLLEDIMALPVADLAAKDCVLFLWAISPMLPHALGVIDAWGFRYRTIGFTWAKISRQGRPAMTMGYWTRAGSELCLLATRGHPERLDRGVRQLIIEPRREHSRKPAAVHKRIERLVAGPRLELFARCSRIGWTCVGDEVDRFSEAAL